MVLFLLREHTGGGVVSEESYVKLRVIMWVEKLLLHDFHNKIVTLQQKKEYQSITCIQFSSAGARRMNLEEYIFQTFFYVSKHPTGTRLN